MKNEIILQARFFVMDFNWGFFSLWNGTQRFHNIKLQIKKLFLLVIKNFLWDNQLCLMINMSNIIIKLSGGTGNQLFQAAAALSLAYTYKKNCQFFFSLEKKINTIEN